jgi:hypothetical protein
MIRWSLGRFTERWRRAIAGGAPEVLRGERRAALGQQPEEYRDEL